MKKIALLFLLITAVWFSAQAQFYVRAGGGYALPVAKQTIGLNTEWTYMLNSGTINYIEEDVKDSYGAGFNFNLGVGYNFSKFVGVDLNFSYLMGKTIETSSKEGYDDSFVIRSTTMSSEVKSLFITPSIVLTAGEGTKTPFARFGIIAGLPTVEGDSVYYDGYALSTTETIWKQKKGASFGFQGAIGMNWVLNNNIKLVTELNFVSMSYAPEERVVTSYTYNGQDIMGQLTEYQKKTIYKEQVVSNSGTRPAGDQPKEEVRVNLPFSSVSFQIGVVYVFGGINVE